MPKKKELKENDLRMVVGAKFEQVRYRCKCNDCGETWSTNNIKYTKKCSKCASTNIKVY